MADSTALVVTEESTSQVESGQIEHAAESSQETAHKEKSQEPIKMDLTVKGDMLTPEQKRERTIRMVEEILSRKNNEAAHVHHRTIEARAMFRRQQDIAWQLRKMRDDFLNMEVEVNDMKRKMMLKRNAPSGVWRADKFIYTHPHTKYCLKDFL